MSIHGSPNVTQTMVCASMAHHTLRRQWFAHSWLETIRSQWFEHPWLTKRYADNALSIHGSPNTTQTMHGSPKRSADNGFCIIRLTGLDFLLVFALPALQGFVFLYVLHHPAYIRLTRPTASTGTKNDIYVIWITPHERLLSIRA